MAMTDSSSISNDSSLEERIRAIRLVAFDFDGVFTDNMVYVFEDGSEAVRCWRGDGIGLRKLERAGIEAVIISSEPNPVVLARSRKLGIRCVHGCEDKLAALENVVREMDLSLAQVAFVGNDINDLPCLICVGLPIVVQDAHPEVISHARYQTRARGGYGAVREICDLFERVLDAVISDQPEAEG
jgi:3-deoxy-D-manno-octulosonate 8-phosphate phosphatase (KDO 8-P phosphatase)